MFLKLFPLYALLLWAADDGGAGGGDTSTGEGDLPGDPPPGPAAGSGAPTGGDTSGSSGATFTQIDLDRIAGKTRKEALGVWAKEQGFERVEDLEAVIKAKQEADDQAKTDLEKAQADAAREKTAREQTEQRLYNAVLRAAFDRAAGEQVAEANLDLAYLAAKSAGLLASDGGIEVDVDKSTVIGLDKVIEKLLKDTPILKKTSQAAPAGTGGADGGNTPAAPTREQDDQARRTYGIKPQRS